MWNALLRPTHSLLFPHAEAIRQTKATVLDYYYYYFKSIINALHVANTLLEAPLRKAFADSDVLPETFPVLAVLGFPHSYPAPM